MSTLKVNSIQNTSGVDLLTPIESGRAKAWVHFRQDATTSGGTLNPIRESFNVTSVTDVSTGISQINFTNNFTPIPPSSNQLRAGYAAVANGALDRFSNTEINTIILDTINVGTLDVLCYRLQSSAAVLRDFEIVSVAIFSE